MKGKYADVFSCRFIQHFALGKDSWILAHDFSGKNGVFFVELRNGLGVRVGTLPTNFSVATGFVVLSART